jgi:hypothetical protein
MRTLLLVLAVAACQIPKEHFVKPGDGGGDGMKTDGLPDTPLTGTSNAYAIDPSMGLFKLSRDRATGKLTLDSTTPAQAPAALDSVTDPNGSHVYAVIADSTNPRIQAFAIASNGTLSALPAVAFAHCYPQIAAIDPTGNFIAVGCSTPYVAVVPISTTSTSGLGTPIETAAGVTPQAAAWSNDGKCVFFADPGAGPTQPNVLAYAFDPSTQSLSQASVLSGPATASAVATGPTANTLFVAGRGTPNNGQVQQYQYTATCGMSAMNPPVSIGMNVELAKVDPMGANLYVTDGGLWAFTITPNGLVPYANNPYFATTGIAFGVTIHPSLPNIVYVTGYAYQGTIVVTNDGNGNLSQTSSLSPSGSTNFLQLEP